MKVLYLILASVVFPAFNKSLLCMCFIYLFTHSPLNKLLSYFWISLIIGLSLGTGSFVITLPILTAITLANLRSHSSKDNFNVLLIIHTIYIIASILDNPIYVLLGGNLDAKVLPMDYEIKALIATFFIMFLAYIVSKLIKKYSTFKIELSSAQIRTRITWGISLPLTLFIGAVPVIIFKFDKKVSDYIGSNFLPQLLPLISILLINLIIYNYDRSIEISIKLKREVEERKSIEEYSRVIENMYSETRRFKHDYMNMLTTLKGYIDTDNMNELKDFFYNNIIDMDKDIKWNNSNIDKLKYIKIASLKAILSSKLIQAVSSGVDIKVEILEDISYISINVMDLCRIIGILMDNAIEASTECEYPKLALCIVNKNDYVVITIENNFFGEKPLIHNLFKEGFSTKGNGRGLGLYTVKDIIDTKYENVFLNTSVENSKFIQEMWIKGQ